jgi:hypothetical protein
MFQNLFARNRASDIIITLGINKNIQAIPFCKRTPLSRLMLRDPARDISRYTNIKNPIGAVGNDVDPAAFLGHGCG